MTIATDKILDRVRKLLALAERAGTPEEAGTAYAQAQRLIAQHTLTEEQIRQARMRDTGERRDEPVICRIIYRAPGSTMPTWIGILSHCLEGVNGCVGCYSNPPRGAKGEAIQKCWGRESDIALVEELLRVISGQIDAMCDASKFAGRTARNNFRLGAVSVVCERLRRAASDARKAIEASAREQDMSAPESARECTALALRALDERGALARVVMEKETGKLRRGRSSSTYDHAAREAGKRAGATVSITRTRAIG